jgi:hypothetical protein
MENLMTVDPRQIFSWLNKYKFYLIVMLVLVSASYVFNNVPTAHAKSSFVQVADTSILYEEDVLYFIERFSKVAVVEHEKFDIPASHILAAAILLSEGGRSTEFTTKNNAFDMICQNGFDCVINVNATIDAYTEFGNAWSSFRGFSIFIVNNMDDTTSGRNAIGKFVSLSAIDKIIEKYKLSKYDTKHK